MDRETICFAKELFTQYVWKGFTSTVFYQEEYKQHTIKNTDSMLKAFIGQYMYNGYFKTLALDLCTLSVPQWFTSRQVLEAEPTLR